MNPNQPSPLDSAVDIGHVDLHVSDLDRAVDFYRDVLGFTVRGRRGEQVALLAAGDYHHHIGLNTFRSSSGGRSDAGTIGLDHVALRYATRNSLAQAVRRLLSHGVELTGASDHGTHEAVHFNDLDGNGLELSWDRPRHEWPRTARGDLALITLPLDVGLLLALAPSKLSNRRPPR
jgi:catechol 2,3-dioxygenase